jgi:hypothetical protein
MGHQRDVLVVIGVGGMGQAIARRLGSGKTVVLADHNEATLRQVADRLTARGHLVEAHEVDVTSATSLKDLAAAANELGAVTQVAHTAGLSPSQASTAAILAVDLLGVALVLDEFESVIAPGGAGIVIASMAGHPPSAPIRRPTTRARTHAASRVAVASILEWRALDRFKLGVRNRQAGQPPSCSGGQFAMGSPWCTDQLDQPRDHLDTDGSSRVEFPAGGRHARDDRGVVRRSYGHLRRHRGRRRVPTRSGGFVRDGNRCARRRWRHRGIEVGRVRHRPVMPKADAVRT